LISAWAVKIASDAHDIARATLALEKEYKERSMQPYLTASWSEFDYSFTIKNAGVGPWSAPLFDRTGGIADKA
jgi:hypothetical protein